MRGYKGTKPDVGWWIEQIRAGEAYRDKHSYRDRWPVWRKYYRNEFKRDILPKNLFFMMVRTIVPRVYFRNPSVSVTPCKPGPMNAMLAKILERIDNKLIMMMRMKETMRMMIQSTYMFGTSPGTLGFGAQYTPTPDFGFTEAPTSRDGYNLEYRRGVLPNMPWFMQTPLDCYVVPAGVKHFDEAFFHAQWVSRDIDEVRADPRLKHTNKLTAASNQKSYRNTELGNFYEHRDFIRLCQIRDMRTNQVFIIAPDLSDDVLLQDFDDLQYNSKAPHYQLVFNPDDEVPYGVPDSKLLEPYQLEANEIKTQIMKHRRASIVKAFVKKGTISADEISKMTSEDVLAMVQIDGSPRDDLVLRDASGIPPELFSADAALMQDVREMTGFGRNQFGDYKPGSSDTTATEAEIVRMASEIRVDERRDQVADLMVDVIDHMHNIIFKHWTQQQVIDIAGPMGVPIWVQFTGQMLKAGSYEVKIDPDTAIPETKQYREQKAMQFYAQAINNPMIDPHKLTTFLLHEHYGVAYDDLMRGVPMAGLMGPVDMMTAVQLYSALAQQAQALFQQPGAGGAPQQLTQDQAAGGGEGVA